jgi:hypothetical protein
MMTRIRRQKGGALLKPTLFESFQQLLCSTCLRRPKPAIARLLSLMDLGIDVDVVPAGLEGSSCNARSKRVEA